MSNSYLLDSFILITLSSRMIQLFDTFLSHPSGTFICLNSRVVERAPPDPPGRPGRPPGTVLCNRGPFGVRFAETMSELETVRRNGPTKSLGSLFSTFGKGKSPLSLFRALEANTDSDPVVALLLWPCSHF